MVKDQKIVKYTEKERADAWNMIKTLWGYNAKSVGKWQRNYNRYQNNGKRAVPSLWSVRSDIIPGYDLIAQSNPKSGVQTSINALKSAVDTVVSKISQARVRPFFQAVMGDYKTIKACRAAQEFFDGFFDREDIYSKGTLTLRDGCIFERGVLWVDEDSETIQRVKTWQVAIDPSEFEYAGQAGLTRASLHRKDYPFRLIEKVYGPVPELKTIDRDNVEHADEFAILWDLAEKRKWYFYGSECFRCVEVDYDVSPFVFLYWNPPVKGNTATSLIDENYTIQVQIDELQLRIDAASRGSMFNTVYVPKGSGIKASTLSNESGAVYEYDPGPVGSAPVVSAPPAISAQYLEMLKMYISTIFENAGISQLSAQSKKPAGVDSGRAIQTLADIESERFNVLLQSYLRFYINLANVCIEVFPENADIVAGKYGKSTAKWKDVKKMRDSYNIQFSAGSALSKDPTRRITEVDMLIQRGLIPGEMAAELLQIPDIEGAYSVSNAAYDYAQTVVECSIETGDIDFLEVADLSLLFQEGVRWLLRLAADEANEKYISNLKKLLNKVQKSLGAIEASAPMAPSDIGMAGKTSGRESVLVGGTSA